MNKVHALINTRNEQAVSYTMLAFATAVIALFATYLVLLFSVTQTAYAINHTEKTETHYLETFSELENNLHAKRMERVISRDEETMQKFATISDITYKPVNTQTYSLAR